MEAAIRTAYEKLTGSMLPRLELDAVRGLDGVKEAIIPLHDENGKGLPIDLRVAVCNGLGNAKKLIKRLRDGEVQYDFVEVMACPGGCINGTLPNDQILDRKQASRLQCRFKAVDNPEEQKNGSKNGSTVFTT